MNSESATSTNKPEGLIRPEANQTYTEVDFSGQSFHGLDLSQTTFFKCQLNHCDFSATNLANCDFTGSELMHCDFTQANLKQAGFGHCQVTHSQFFNAKLNHATLTGANFSDSDFRASNLSEVRAHESNFSQCDFSDANLTHADLSHSEVKGAYFHQADLTNAKLLELKGYTKAQWYGCDIRQVNFAGAYMLRRLIIDQNYLHEFRTRGPLNKLLYTLWWLTSDCGRSLSRWSLLIVIQIALFGYINSHCLMNYGSHPTPLSPYYFSITTMTTLGIGDVTPCNIPAQLAVIAQVFTGYLMLGGLLSILTCKLARRAD